MVSRAVASDTSAAALAPQARVFAASQADVLDMPAARPAPTIEEFALEVQLRDGLEQTYRELATMTATTDERVALVDAANGVRRWTFR